MKIYLLITILSLSYILCFGQCGSVLDAVEKVIPLRQQNYHKIVYNKDSVFVFNDTSIWYATKKLLPKKSIADGKWILFSSNDSVIMIECKYKDSLLDGEVIFRNKRGIITEKSNYFHGEINGEQYKYYDDGELSQKLNYKNGLRNGKEINYSRNGSIFSQCNYNIDKMNGVYESWWDNNYIRSRHSYLNGLLNGAFYDWDNKGRIENYSYYLNGKPEGLSIVYEQGILKFERYYENGELIKEVQEYYDIPDKSNSLNHEILIKKEAYKNDSLITIITYFKNCIKESETSIKYIGTVDCEKIYNRVGHHKYWNKNGKLIKELIYEDDKLINEKNYR